MGTDGGTRQIAAKIYAKGSCSQAGRLQVLAGKSNRLSDFYVKLTTTTTPAAKGGNRSAKWSWKAWRRHSTSPSI